MTPISTTTKNPASIATVVGLSALGVVLAPLTLLISGVANVLYLTDGMTWAGVLLSAVVAAAAIVIAASRPTVGIIAGSVCGGILLAFGLLDITAGSRPDLGLNGVIVFGGSGPLSSALVACFLATGAVASRGARMKD